MACEIENNKRSPNIASINMTPMIDVLLVLLAIFMIAQPVLLKTIDVQIPREKPSEATAASAPPIVLEISADGNYSINKRPIAADNLETTLQQVYMNRPDKVLFIKADGDVVYEEVVAALDAARGAGVSVLGAVLGS